MLKSLSLITTLADFAILYQASIREFFFSFFFSQWLWMTSRNVPLRRFSIDYRSRLDLLSSSPARQSGWT